MSANRFKIRFSLRSLLVLLTLFTVLFAWLGLRYSECRQESKIVEALVAEGVAIDTFPKSNSFLDRTFQNTLVLSAYNVDLGLLKGQIDEDGKLIDLVAQLRYVRELGYRPNEDLRHLSKLRDLRQLEVVGWATDSLEGIENCKQLEKLYLYESDHIESIEPLRGMAKLEFIYQSLEDSSSLKLNPEVVATWTNLREVEILYCEQIELHGFRNLRQLQILDLGHSGKTDGFEALKEMVSLKRLCLPNCGELENLSCFSKLKNLEELVLYDCTNLKNVDGILKLPNLKEVWLNDCHELTDFSSFANMTSLIQLTLIGGRKSPSNWGEQRSEQAKSLQKAMPWARIRVKRRYSF